MVAPQRCYWSHVNVAQAQQDLKTGIGHKAVHGVLKIAMGHAQEAQPFALLAALPQ